jgi:hypothetical protein
MPTRKFTSELERIETMQESLRQRIESMFGAATMGPLRAYLDIPKKNGTKDRMWYRTIHIGGNNLPEVIDEVYRLVRSLRHYAKGLPTLIWRIPPTIEKHSPHWTVRTRLLIPELNWESDEVKRLFKEEGEPYKVLRPKAFASMYG